MVHGNEGTAQNSGVGRRRRLAGAVSRIAGAAPQPAGYSHGAVGHGRLVAADAQPFRLLVCDLKMPRMDGLQVLSLLRRRFPELRTVALTGLSDGEFPLARLRAGRGFVLAEIRDAAESAEVSGVHRVAAGPAGRRRSGRARHKSAGHHPDGTGVAQFERAARHVRVEVWRTSGSRTDN